VCQGWFQLSILYCCSSTAWWLAIPISTIQWQIRSITDRSRVGSVPAGSTGENPENDPFENILLHHARLISEVIIHNPQSTSSSSSRRLQCKSHVSVVQGSHCCAFTLDFWLSRAREVRLILKCPWPLNGSIGTTSFLDGRPGNGTHCTYSVSKTKSGFMITDYDRDLTTAACGNACLESI
jgi:hypothetical protein